MLWTKKRKFVLIFMPSLEHYTKMHYEMFIYFIKTLSDLIIFLKFEVQWFFFERELLPYWEVWRHFIAIINEWYHYQCHFVFWFLFTFLCRSFICDKAEGNHLTVGRHIACFHGANANYSSEYYVVFLVWSWHKWVLCVYTGVSSVRTFSNSGDQCTAIPAKCLDVLLAAEHTGGHDEYFTSSPSWLLLLPAFSPPSFSLTHVPLSLSLWPTSLWRSSEPIRDAIKAFVAGCLRCVQVCLSATKSLWLQARQPLLSLTWYAALWHTILAFKSHYIISLCVE